MFMNYEARQQAPSPAVQQALGLFAQGHPSLPFLSCTSYCQAWPSLPGCCETKTTSYVQNALLSYRAAPTCAPESKSYSANASLAA